MIFELVDSSEESTQETIEEESFLPPSASSPPPSPPPLPPSPPTTTPPPEQCRICFEIEQFDDPLLHPCLCNGTSKFVHKFCLQKWRSINYNKPASLKCMECNFLYIIKYRIPREYFFYSDRNIHQFNSLLITIVMNILMLCGSLFMQTVAVELNLNPIYLIDNKPTATFLKITNGESLYGHIYYYSTGVFFCSIIIHTSFLMSSLRKVINKKKYWKKMVLRFVLHSIFAIHFIWIYYICKADHKSSPKTFLNFEILFNLMYFHMIGKLLLSHNKILNDINSDNIGYVKNRLLIV